MENFEIVIKNHMEKDKQFRKEIERYQYYGYYCEVRKNAYYLWQKGLPVRMAFGFSH